VTLRPVFFVVADKDMEQMFRGFLGRKNAHLSLGCGEFDVGTSDLVAAPHHDPGLYTRASDYARPPRSSHRNLVIALDAEWEGSPGARKIEQQIRASCVDVGWSPGNVCVVVLDPEIETWIWQDNQHVEQALAHRGPPSLRQDLEASGDWPTGAAKPRRPKEVLEAVLRKNRIPRSSALYRRIAERVSIKHCVDPGLATLVEALRRWFPP
jgi:hypothetical protein